MLFAELQLPQMMFLAGLFALVIILWTRSKRAFRRVTPRTPPGTLPPLPASMQKPNVRQATSAHASLTANIERQQVALHDMARDVAGEVDSKLRLLQLATIQANAAAERLEAALTAAGIHLDEPAAAIATAADFAAMSGWEFAPLSAFSAPPGVAVPLAGEAQQREIYRLADAGHGASRIAQLTGVQQGEVELLLSIRPRK